MDSIYLKELINTLKENKIDGRGQYCVFDWDETCVHSDTQDMVLMYILENKLCKINPKKIYAILLDEIKNDNSAKYKKVSQLVADIDKAYNKYFFYDVEEYRMELVSKVFYSYKLIGKLYTRKKAYRWIMKFFTGLSKEDLKSITAIVIDFYANSNIEERTLTSPNIKSKYGLISLKFKIGLLANKDTLELIDTLKQCGFDIYVVTASLQALIKFTTEHKSFQNLFNIDNIYGVRMKYKNGNFLQTFVGKVPIPMFDGKTKLIKKYIEPKYGYGPFLVAGDSFGDYKMMVDFKTTSNIVLMNKNNLLLRTFVSKYKKSNARIVISN